MALMLALIILQILSANGFLRSSEESQGNEYTYNGNGDVGEPLFLTPYIESGKIKEARELARVTLPGNMKNIESYAGFFTVNKTYNSNHFVWYFPAEQKFGVTIVWLQGGPGASSLFGLFEENGPIYVENDKLLRRPQYWSQYFNVIYIDNPVGSGFSFTNTTAGYATDQTQIAEQLYSTLTQMYRLFPELGEDQLVISGESYGGKHAPSLAYKIHKSNPGAAARGDPVLPLAGVTVGNGWCDPTNQLEYAEYLYQLGLLSFYERNLIDQAAESTRQLIKNGDWDKALSSWITTLRTALDFMTQVSLYDYTIIGPEAVDQSCRYCDLVNTEQIRKAIHVGSRPFHDLSNKVYWTLGNDFMKSVAPWITELLEHYKMWFYNGQQDIIVAYPLTENVLRGLKWSGSEEYQKAPRIKLYLDNDDGTEDFMGYSKFAGNLTETMIRGGGHMIPGDQPEWTLTLLVFWCLDNNITQYTGNLNEVILKREPTKMIMNSGFQIRN